MSNMFYYQGKLYPDYLKRGNAVQFIVPTAAHFCKGRGLDVGAGRWPFPGAIAVDTVNPVEENNTGFDAYNLPLGEYDYVFSSHCLEHLPDTIGALEHWQTRLRPGGVLFLYLPHPDMTYWRPQNCRKHLHMFWPEDVAEMLRNLGFVDVIHSERDLMWSFAVAGYNGSVEEAA